MHYQYGFKTKPLHWRIILVVTANSYGLLWLKPKLLTVRYLYALLVGL